MDERKLLHDILNELRQANGRDGSRRFGPDRTDPREGLHRDGEGMPNDPIEAMRKRIENFNKKVDQGHKTLTDLNNSQKKVFKTMLEGVPVLGKLFKATKKTADKIEEYSVGQSEAYKRSIKATNEYATSAGANAKELKQLQEKLHETYESSQRLTKLSKDKETIEREIVKSLSSFNVKSLKIADDFSDIDQTISAIRKRLKKEDDPEKVKNLENAIEKLGVLNEIPDEVDKLKKSLSDVDFAKLLEKNPEFKKIFKPILDALEKGHSGEVAKNIGELKDTEEALLGVMDGLNLTIQYWIGTQEQLQREFKVSIRNLGKAISAALGEAIVKESMMVMTRQRLTGAPMGYAARLRAAEMGMSETDALTSLAENRYLFRRIGQEGGMRGAGELLQTGQLNELRMLSREMGLVGKEALDNLVQVSTDLRVIGADLTKINISDSVRFIRDSFKDLGLTQEQMRQFFGEMSREGMLATMAAGPSARFANLEAIQQEIKFRGELARVLNQELDIQKKRVQEMSQAAYGSPAEAIRKSIGVEILAQTTGMSAGDQALLGEYMRTGGRSMNAEQKRRAMFAREQLGLNVGHRLDVAAQEDRIGERAFLTQIMGMGGIDAMEAVQAYQRNRGRTVGGIGLARTDEPAYETNELLNKAVSVFEYGQGALKSAIGNSTAAIVGTLWAITPLIIASNLAGARGMGMGATLKGMGKGALRNAGNIAKFSGRATGVGAGIYGLGKMATGSRFSTGEAIATGAGIGATIGSFVPIPIVGTLAGAAIGGAVGWGASKLQGESQKDRMARYLAMSDTLGGGKGLSSEQQQKVLQLENEIQEAWMSNDTTTLNKKMKEREMIQTSPEVAGLAMNLMRIRDLRQQDGGKLERLDRTNPLGGRAKRVIDPELERQTSLQIVEAVESGAYKGLGEESIRTMINELINNEIEEDKEDKLIEVLEESLKALKEVDEKALKEIIEGNELRKKHYGELSEGELKQRINNRLMSLSNAAIQAGTGGAQDYVRD
jgi:hypothetical protein